MTKGTLQYNKKRFFSLTNGSGSTGYSYGKIMNLVTYFTPYAKINSKWIIVINVTVKI